MSVKIIAEVTPGRMHGVERYFPEVAELSDAVDIPESPMGIPHPNSVATAAYVRARYGCDVIPHVRLADVNRVSLLSHAYAAKMIGAYGLVMLRGEYLRPSWISSSEEAAKVVRGSKGLMDLRLGAILSLRFRDEYVLERVKSLFNFFLVIRADPYEPFRHERVLSTARRMGKEVYPYIIVATRDNREVVAGVKQPFIAEDELRRVVEGFEGLVDGVVVSVPHDPEGLKRCLRVLSRR